MADSPIPGLGPWTARRKALMLEATYEQDALQTLLLDLTHCLPTDPHEVKALLRQIRGITIRVRELTSVLMSAVDDEVEDDARLARRLYMSAEPSHG